MDYLNLYLPELESPDFLTATTEQLATWLYLVAYCARQENGGKITGCRKWEPQHWERIVRINANTVHDETALWSWADDSLCVRFYPLRQEDKCRANRESGKRGGRPAGNHMVSQPVNHMDNHTPNHAATMTETEREEKGEGKKEKKSNGMPSPAGKPPHTHFSKFPPPTPEEVKAYCKERNNQVDASKFVDFYASKGWIVGKTQMKDWKAAVRTWEKNATNGPTSPVPGSFNATPIIAHPKQCPRCGDKKQVHAIFRQSGGVVSTAKPDKWGEPLVTKPVRCKCQGNNNSEADYGYRDLASAQKFIADCAALEAK